MGCSKWGEEQVNMDLISVPILSWHKDQAWSSCPLSFHHSCCEWLGCGCISVTDAPYSPSGKQWWGKSALRTISHHQKLKCRPLQQRRQKFPGIVWKKLRLSFRIHILPLSMKAKFRQQPPKKKGKKNECWNVIDDCGWLTFSIETKIAGVRLFHAEDRAVKTPQRDQWKYISQSAFQSNIMTNDLCCPFSCCIYFPVIALWDHKWIPTNLILTSGRFVVCLHSRQLSIFKEMKTCATSPFINMKVHDRSFSCGNIQEILHGLWELTYSNSTIKKR